MINMINKLIHINRFYTCFQIHKRLFSCSTSLQKKYKYAIDLKKQKPSVGIATQQFKYKKGLSIVDGKALTYFKFDDHLDFEESDKFVQLSPKQQAYAEIVQESVESLLSSREVPQEINDIAIDIVNVEVSESLTSAIIYWNISTDLSSKYSKEETKDLLKTHLPYLRSSLPAYSTVTQTPIISFIYDHQSEKEGEINSLFELIQSDQ